MFTVYQNRIMSTFSPSKHINNVFELLCEELVRRYIDILYYFKYIYGNKWCFSDTMIVCTALLVLNKEALEYCWTWIIFWIFLFQSFSTLTNTSMDTHRRKTCDINVFYVYFFECFRKSLWRTKPVDNNSLLLVNAHG